MGWTCPSFPQESRAHGPLVPATFISSMPGRAGTGLWVPRQPCWGLGCHRGEQGVLTAVPLASFSPDVGGPADPIAPTIIVPPRNTSVVAGTSEVTMECVANARRVASRQTGWGRGISLLASPGSRAGCPQVPSHQGSWVPRDGVRWGFGGVQRGWDCLSTCSRPPHPRPLIKLHIIWKKDGVPLSSGISDYSRRLTILNPTLSDSGYYECEAVLRSSSVPAVAEGAYLSVLGEALATGSLNHTCNELRRSQPQG